MNLYGVCLLHATVRVPVWTFFSAWHRFFWPYGIYVAGQRNGRPDCESLSCWLAKVFKFIIKLYSSKLLSFKSHHPLVISEVNSSSVVLYHPVHYNWHPLSIRIHLNPPVGSEPQNISNLKTLQIQSLFNGNYSLAKSAPNCSKHAPNRDFIE